MSKFFQAGSESDSESGVEEEVVLQRPSIPSKWVVIVCLYILFESNAMQQSNYDVYFYLAIIEKWKVHSARSTTSHKEVWILCFALPVVSESHCRQHNISLHEDQLRSLLFFVLESLRGSNGAPQIDDGDNWYKYPSVSWL